MEQVAALESSPVPFWEIAPENVVGQGGTRHRQVMKILERDPVITHGLSMSMGGFDAWDRDFLDNLKEFLKATRSPWHSEHLCWTSFGGATTHELWVYEPAGGWVLEATLTQSSSDGEVLAHAFSPAKSIRS